VAEEQASQQRRQEKPRESGAEEGGRAPNDRSTRAQAGQELARDPEEEEEGVPGAVIEDVKGRPLPGPDEGWVCEVEEYDGDAQPYLKRGEGVAGGVRGGLGGGRPIVPSSAPPHSPLPPGRRLWRRGRRPPPEGSGRWRPKPAGPEVPWQYYIISKSMGFNRFDTGSI